MRIINTSPAICAGSNVLCCVMLCSMLCCAVLLLCALRFLIGVWEFITSKEAVDLVGDCETPEEACRLVSGPCSCSNTCCCDR